MYDLKDIAASLQYGKPWSQFITRSIFALIILFTACTILLIIVAVIELIELIFVAFVLFILVGLMIVYLVYVKRLKEKITLWMEDAVKLEAVSKAISRYPEYSWNGNYSMKLKVMFEYDNTRYEKISGTPGYKKPHDNSLKAGYSLVFNRYADRKINILYSKKYNQVLILNATKQYSEII